MPIVIRASKEMTIKEFDVELVKWRIGICVLFFSLLSNQTSLNILTGSHCHLQIINQVAISVLIRMDHPFLPLFGLICA